MNREIPPYEHIRVPSRFNAGRLRALGLGVFAVVAVAAVLAFFNYGGASTGGEEESVVAEARPLARIENNNANAVSVPVSADVFDGVVTKVITGDAIAVRDLSNRERQVRMLDIAAPKLDDKFGNDAKESLSAAVLGKSVQVLPVRVEESGLVLARVLRDGRNVGLEQIRSGFAAANNFLEQSAEERKLYAETESFARKAGLGLWSGGQPGPATAPDLALGSGTFPRSGPGDLPVPNDLPPYRYPSPPSASKPGEPVRSDDTKLPSMPSSPVTSKGTFTMPVIPAPTPPSPPEARVDLKTEITSVPANNASARTYIRGPRGGCYYINSKGTKSYVDHSLCQ